MSRPSLSDSMERHGNVYARTLEGKLDAARVPLMQAQERYNKAYAALCAIAAQLAAEGVDVVHDSENFNGCHRSYHVLNGCAGHGEPAHVIGFGSERTSTPVRTDVGNRLRCLQMELLEAGAAMTLAKRGICTLLLDAVGDDIEDIMWDALSYRRSRAQGGLP